MEKTKILAITFISVSLAATAVSVRAEDLSKRVKGRILLQIEARGEAWYVDPQTEERSYMGRPDDAFNLMREAGVGITNADIKKIQVGDKNLNTNEDGDEDGLSDIVEEALGTNKENTDSDGDGINDKTEILSGYDPNNSDSSSYLIDSDFSAKQAGKILLQVEQNGEAWYVNPEDNKRYFLSRPQDAFSIMRELGLGISNENLDQIKENGKAAVGGGAKKENAENLKNKIDNDICNDLSEGDVCELIGRNNESIAGVCKLVEEKLICAPANMPDDQKRGGQRGGAPEEMLKICSNLNEGDACKLTGRNNETINGICQLNDNDQLMCHPENMTDTPNFFEN